MKTAISPNDEYVSTAFGNDSWMFDSGANGFVNLRKTNTRFHPYRYRTIFSVTEFEFDNDQTVFEFDGEYGVPTIDVNWIGNNQLEILIYDGFFMPGGKELETNGNHYVISKMLKTWNGITITYHPLPHSK